jgi:ABC-type glycerol-3-phosphate transport system substrate-binding protein
LKEFVKTIESGKFYPPFRMIDPNGRNWGISVTLTTPVILGNRKIASLPCGDFTWQALLPYLREIKKKKSELLYPFAFNGYFTFLMHEGVRMIDTETGGLLFSEENFTTSLKLLKDMLGEGIAPLFSEIYYARSGQRWFENKQIAAREAFHSNLKSLMPFHPEFDILPMPAPKGIQRTVYSEFFTICTGSMYYNTAWDFIKFALSPEIQRFLVTENTMMPALRNLKPPHLSTEQFDVLSKSMEKSIVKIEEYYLPVPIRLIIETEIDRWIKFGGRIDDLLNDLEKSCRQRMSCLNMFSDKNNNREFSR